jgi:hypothetical protein
LWNNFNNRPFRDNFRTCAETLPDGKPARFHCKLYTSVDEIRVVGIYRFNFISLIIDGSLTLVKLQSDKLNFTSSSFNVRVFSKLKFNVDFTSRALFYIMTSLPALVNVGKTPAILEKQVVNMFMLAFFTYLYIGLSTKISICLFQLYLTVFESSFSKSHNKSANERSQQFIKTLTWTYLQLVSPR